MQEIRELIITYDKATEEFSKARGELYQAKELIFEYCIANKLWYALELRACWRRRVNEG